MQLHEFVGNYLAATAITLHQIRLQPETVAGKHISETDTKSKLSSGALPQDFRPMRPIANHIPKLSSGALPHDLLLWVSDRPMRPIGHASKLVQAQHRRVQQTVCVSMKPRCVDKALHAGSGNNVPVSKPQPHLHKSPKSHYPPKTSAETGAPS